MFGGTAPTPESRTEIRSVYGGPHSRWPGDRVGGRSERRAAAVCSAGFAVAAPRGRGRRPAARVADRLLAGRGVALTAALVAAD
jgi:dipeptidyl aminopeptidase/acylaminoacyl peptidase